MYIVVAGAGHMGTHLISRLIAAGHETVVIDVDKDVTDRLFAEHGVVVFNGSATDVNVLDQAGIKRAAVAVAMTGRDPDNLAFCLLARYYGVPRGLARMLNPRPLRSGETVEMSLDLSQAHLFAADSGLSLRG